MFVADISLVFLAALRPLRLLRPILVLRRFGSVTTRNDGDSAENNRREEDTYFAIIAGALKKIRYVMLILYAFVLMALSTSGLILQSELAVGNAANIRTYGNALWFSIGQLTLTGSQYGPVTLWGRTYSVILLLLGLGIVGLFANSFEHIWTEGLRKRGAQPIAPPKVDASYDDD